MLDISLKLFTLLNDVANWVETDPAVDDVAFRYNEFDMRNPLLQVVFEAMPEKKSWVSDVLYRIEARVKIITYLKPIRMDEATITAKTVTFNKARTQIDKILAENKYTVPDVPYLDLSGGWDDKGSIDVGRAKKDGMWKSEQIVTAVYYSTDFLLINPPTFSNQIPYVQPYDYIIYDDGETCRAKNCHTGRIDYENDDVSALISATSFGMGSGVIYVAEMQKSSSSTMTLLESHQTVIFDSNFVLTYTGSGEAIKMGSNTVQPSQNYIRGNFTTIKRATLGGTYGIHLENCHLCSIEGMTFINFAIAPVYLEGSWGSWVDRVEVNSGAGQYGLLLDATQAGFTENLGDLVTIYQCWLQGSDAAIRIQGNPEDIVIENCDLHNSYVGIAVDSVRNLHIKNNYFEANTNGCINLIGGDAPVCAVRIDKNFFAWDDPDYYVIYCSNVQGVTVTENDCNPPEPVEDPPSVWTTSVFVGSPDTYVARQIYIDRNRMGIPSWVNEFEGYQGGLIYHYRMENASAGIGGCLKTSLIENAVPLRWIDNVGVIRECLALEGTNILRLHNPVGDIQLSTDAVGKYILFYDDYSKYQMAKWTVGWSCPMVIRGDNLGSLGTSDYGKMWYNDTVHSIVIWDGTMYRQLVPNPVNLVLTPETDNYFDLGTSTHKFKDAFFSGTVNCGPVSGTTLSLSGNLIEINAIAHELDPSVDNTYALGNAGLKWSNIVAVLGTFSGQVYTGGYFNTEDCYKRGGVKVVGAQEAYIAQVSVPDPNSVGDYYARVWINYILTALKNHGLVASG